MVGVGFLGDRRLWVLRGETQDKGSLVLEEGFGALRGFQASWTFAVLGRLWVWRIRSERPRRTSGKFGVIWGSWSGLGELREFGVPGQRVKGLGWERILEGLGFCEPGMTF